MKESAGAEQIISPLLISLSRNASFKGRGVRHRCFIMYNKDQYKIPILIIDVNSKKNFSVRS
jgi:hypothetical protein